MDQKDAQLEQGATPENNNQENHNMASLLAQEGPGIDFPTAGEIRTGVIASLTPGQILVSVGTKSEGVITGKEYEAIPRKNWKPSRLARKSRSMSSTPKIKRQSGSFLRAGARRGQLGRGRSPASLPGPDLSQPHYRLQQGRFDRPGRRIARFCARFADQPVPPRQHEGDTPEQRWSSMIGQEIDVLRHRSRPRTPPPDPL